MGSEKQRGRGGETFGLNATAGENFDGSHV